MIFPLESLLAVLHLRVGRIVCLPTLGSEKYVKPYIFLATILGNNFRKYILNQAPTFAFGIAVDVSCVWERPVKRKPSGVEK